MNKFFTMLFMASVLSVMLTACGDNDEPVVPDAQKIESVYENETDTHYMFDIDMDKDSSDIYLYNVSFTIGDRVSPPMTLRIPAPVTVDKSGNVFTYAGTGIVADMQRGTTWMPMTNADYLVHNLTCMVNTKNKTFAISFDCHGGHFEDNGKIL